MENFTDYSNYINAAYIVTALVLCGLMAFVVIKFFKAK